MSSMERHGISLQDPATRDNAVAILVGLCIVWTLAGELLWRH